ncbi:MAG TPA: transglycosylase SLT domain-containing protein [Dyella sp.]|uniref:transglycosylase SLT domain-containing protein n=1 Tax=Dyella sp. TaxID=1869338 RepID=UPI002F951D9A
MAHESGGQLLSGSGAGCTLRAMFADGFTQKTPVRRLQQALAGVAVLVILALCPAAARAGGLYRCTGASGEAVFSNSAVGYSDCHKLPGTSAPPTAARRARPTMAPIASILGVKGSVETTARTVAEARPAIAPAGEDRTATASSPPGKPGQWTYAESKKALDDTAAALTAPNERVLRGSVYRVVHPDGSVEYTNVAPAGQKGRAVTMLFSYIATCVACNLRSPIHWDSVALNLTAYADTIRAASAEFGVDEAFLRAIIHAESAFNPRALSLKGAQGLMQLMPATANDMGVRDAFDADQNIRGGARYLALLLRNFNGDERLAAAAYNAGANAVLRYNGVPPYEETQVYVERVGTLRKRYGTVVAKAPPVAALGGRGL